MEGFSRPCGSCGHAGGNARRALLWTLIPSGLILAATAANIVHTEMSREGSSRNTYSNAIEVQDAPGRSVAFAKLMRDTGQPCDATTRTMFRGDIGANAAWAIRCTDSGDWFILIAGNGAVRVANCGPMEEAGTPCWTRI